MKVKKIVKALSLSMAIGSLMCGTMVSAASSGSTYINNTYGYLRSELLGGKGSFGKFFNLTSSTTSVVPRIRASIEVQYYSTGKTVGSNNAFWLYKSKKTYDEIELCEFYNKQTSSYDGFVNTKCTAYGTSDAITSIPYVVYTSLVL